MAEKRVVVPIVRGIELPVGVRYLIVNYKLYARFGFIERRQKFWNAVIAQRKYEDVVKFIEGSDEYEEVGIYYSFYNDVLHLIERYSTASGYVKAGEQW